MSKLFQFLNLIKNNIKNTFKNIVGEKENIHFV